MTDLPAGSGIDERLARLEEHLDELESRVAIAALVAGYNRALDRHDHDLFAGLWHDDAVFSNPAARPDIVGIDEITKVQLTIEAAYSRTLHVSSDLVISFQGSDAATCLATGLAVAASASDGTHTWMEVAYDDELERRDGVWKIAKRTVHRWFATDGLDFRPLAERGVS